MKLLLRLFSLIAFVSILPALYAADLSGSYKGAFDSPRLSVGISYGQILVLSAISALCGMVTCRVGNLYMFGIGAQSLAKAHFLVLAPLTVGNINKLATVARLRHATFLVIWTIKNGIKFASWVVNE